MEKFFYRIIKDGQMLTGTIEAKTEKEAAKLLHEQEFFILAITPARKYAGFTLTLLKRDRITLTDVVHFTRQLASMITAGLTLTESLSILKNQTEKPSVKMVVGKILQDIEAGSSFSEALTSHPDVFRPAYIAMVRAAEASGLLDKVLARLSDNLEKEREFRGKVTSALLYPAIVIVGMLVVVLVMMLFVVPVVRTLFTDIGGAALPLPTRIVIALSDFVVKTWFLLIGLLVILFFGFRSFSRTEMGKRYLDTILIRFPIVGPLTKLVILTEMTRTLGLLVGAGTPIIQAITITGDATGNIWYRDSLNDVAKKVEKGVALGSAISEDPNFPSILTEMGKVGETSGKLDEMLLKVSSYFESEAEQHIKTLTTTIEPFIMVVLGIAVAFLLVAVLLPIYSLVQAF